MKKYVKSQFWTVSEQFIINAIIGCFPLLTLIKNCASIGYSILLWLYSGKVDLLGQSDCFRIKVVVFGQSGCNWAKEVVFGQSGCIRVKVVVFG